MAFTFNTDEVFEIAERIEANGAEYYETAASSVSDARYGSLLKDLAKREREHLATFSSLRKELSSEERTSAVSDPDDESSAYLRALADSEVFYGKKTDFSSIRAILLGALDREKDSIVFYVGMKDLVPSVAGKAKIDGIIAEEKRHITALTAELRALKA